MRINILPLVIGVVAFGLCRDAEAITLASVDGFGATSEGWSIGATPSATQPTRSAGVGFDGQAGFLSHFSDSNGANGKWLMFSAQADWIGNYTSAGVSGITFQADNQAGNPLAVRIAFSGPGGWFYSGAQTITNSTGAADWTLLSYTLTSGSFTYLAGSGGTGSFTDTMSGVTRFEILGGASAIVYHSNGNIIEAGLSTNTVGIDNITAVPEPATPGLLVVGWSAVAMMRRRRFIAAVR